MCSVKWSLLMLKESVIAFGTGFVNVIKGLQGLFSGGAQSQL